MGSSRQSTGVGYYFLLQEIFLTQWSNPASTPGRPVLYRWATWASLPFRSLLWGHFSSMPWFPPVFLAFRRMHWQPLSQSIKLLGSSWDWASAQKSRPAICHSNHQLGVVRDTSYWHHADFYFALCVCNVWSKSTWAQYLLAAQPVEVWPASLAAEAVILIALSATILLPGECLTLKSRDETNFPRLHRCRSWETDQVVWLELDKGKFIWHDS